MTKKLLISVFLLTLLLAACQKEGSMDKKEIENRAKNVAIEYLKREKDVDFVVDNYEFLDTTATSTVVVHGHEKQDKDKALSVFVNYENDYEVDTIAKGEVKE